MADEELFFGADDEPVKDEAEGSAVEDAAASDKASAEGSEKENAKAEEAPSEEKTEVKEEAKADDQSSELEARYMSLYAEYDNYRRRTQKEKDNLYADAVASVTKGSSEDRHRILFLRSVLKKYPQNAEQNSIQIFTMR